MPAPVKKLNVSLIKRNAVKRGPTSSDAWNDSFEETVNDLNRIVTQWNDALYPVLAALPDGTNDLDAYDAGLDGRVIYVDQTAVASTADTTYWNSVHTRPNSVKDQFEKVYTKFVTERAAIQAEITNGSGALTQGQKDAIGAHIFDGGATSSSTSLDGKSENNRLNTIQLAKDIYGGGFTLDNDGNANLANSLFAMVDALLELHNGNWDNDVTLDHSLVAAGDFKADGSVPMSGTFKAANGTNALPSITFNSDQDTGLYRVGADQLGVTIGGVNTLTFGGTGAEITAVDGTLNLVGILSTSGLITTAGVLRQTTGYFGNTLNGVGAIAHIFDTLDNYTTADFLAVIRNNGVDKLTVGLSGRVVAKGSVETEVDFVLADGSQLITPSADTAVGLEDSVGITFEVNNVLAATIDQATGDLILENDLEAVDGRFSGDIDAVNLDATGTSTFNDVVVTDDMSVAGDLTTAARILALIVKTTAGDYNVLATDHVVVVNKASGAATAVNLPGSPVTGRTIVVKDGKGDALVNNITITPAAGNIDGAGTKVINTNYGTFTLVYNGTEWNVI